MNNIAALRHEDTAPPVIEAVNVSKKYGDFHALDGIDLQACRGEIVGILGPNGAGKSTLLRACEGLEALNGGRITALGADIAVERGALKGRIGLVLQRPRFSGYATVRETIDLFRSFALVKTPPEQITEALGLATKLDVRVSKLSGGERQRLAVLIGLMAASDIILLDEPTSELDPQARRVVWRMISMIARDHGCAVLMTTHQMEEAELLCDRVYIVDHGRVIASGTPSQIILENCDAVAVTFTVRAAAAERAGPLTAGAETSRHGQFLKCRKRVGGVAEGQALMRELIDLFGLDVVEVGLKRPNLEDVFIELTGAHLRA